MALMASRMPKRTRRRGEAKEVGEAGRTQPEHRSMDDSENAHVSPGAQGRQMKID